MFTASADLYDLVYTAFKDYPAEAADLARRIHDLNPDARRILDVACGTAEHARVLEQTHAYQVDGLDLDPSFVSIARSKLAHGMVYLADMTSFELPHRYDVVMCLFSSIGYAGTLDNVRRALRCFRDHLADGGIIIVEPWFTPDAYHAGRVHARTAEAAGLTVCRMGHSEVVGRISRLQFEYLIGRAEGIERASEIHELGLFTTDEMTACFADVGLDVTYDVEGLSGRGLYMARTA